MSEQEIIKIANFAIDAVVGVANKNNFIIPIANQKNRYLLLCHSIAVVNKIIQIIAENDAEYGYFCNLRKNLQNAIPIFKQKFNKTGL